MKRHALALTFGVLLLTTGCSTIRPVEIRTVPPGATVVIDDLEKGTSPYTHEFDFKDPDAIFKVVIKKQGYLSRRKPVSALYLDAMLERYQDKGLAEDGKEFIVIKIDEDESWTRTTPSDAANVWVNLTANPQMDQSQVWEILVDTVTKYYSELTNLDNKAGYIAAKEKKKRFKRGTTATVWVRNQFFCSIATRSPLVYKIKIQSQINEDGSWKDFGRIFKSDSPLVKELQTKLVAQ